jgi:glyoxylase-like metal-dependent hydrolase (beta-lactamase superfamily II)
MKINKIITDIYGYCENCYLIENNNDVLIVDPGNDYEKIKEKLKNKNIVGILITHYHPDHVGALNQLLLDYNVNIYDYKLEEKEYKINNFKFNIIKTPGHKEDSVTFYFKNEKIMFTGDFVFKLTIGRTDLEGGNMIQMQESIEKIKTYDDDITLYPGHGEETTLKDEKELNYYFT